jgi:hypothetical protein
MNQYNIAESKAQITTGAGAAGYGHPALVDQ